MTRKQSLLESPLRGALAEAADRLSRLERSLRSRNVGDSMAGAEERSPGANPDEEWSRRFMNQGIGPQPELASLRSIETLAKAQHAFRPAPVAAPLAAEVAPPAKGPIGIQIGKPVQQSFFARLFGCG